MTLPFENGTEYRIRVTAIDTFGNRANADSPASFAVDSSPPRVSPVRALVEGFSESVEIPFTAQDEGAAGLARIDVYRYEFEGKAWRRFESIPALSSGAYTIRGGDGKYGLTFVGTDAAGNCGKTPESEADIQCLVSISRNPPDVVVVSPKENEVVKGGATYSVRWRCESSLVKEGGVSIEVSTDGGVSWKSIATGLPNSGEYGWDVPSVQKFSDCSLRIHVTDQYSRRNSVVSEKFSIVSGPPGSKSRFGKTSGKGEEVKTPGVGTEPAGTEKITDQERARRQQFEQAMHMGNQFYQTRDFVRACSYYRQAVDIDGGSVLARHRLGMSLFHGKKPLAAV
ncbi:MAG: hypothetical protein RDV41_02275, partial [Planctomycetota bacterium]|nr:hypothetical protein [Planctomycetota bacterium]